MLADPVAQQMLMFMAGPIVSTVMLPALEPGAFLASVLAVLPVLTGSGAL